MHLPGNLCLELELKTTPDAILSSIIHSPQIPCAHTHLNLLSRHWELIRE